MFWRDKKKFHNPVILFFVFDSFLSLPFLKSKKTELQNFSGCFEFFFHILFLFLRRCCWGRFCFLGIFFCVWGREVFFIIHKQIFDDFSIFLYIFFSLYRHFFFLKLYLKITHGRNLVFVFLFSFKF